MLFTSTGSSAGLAPFSSDGVLPSLSFLGGSGSGGDDDNSVLFFVTRCAAGFFYSTKNTVKWPEYRGGHISGGPD